MTPESRKPAANPASAIGAELQDWARSVCGDGVYASIVQILPGLPLLPGEQIYVANAVHSRRDEFAAGRLAAREALSQLGLDRVAIPRGKKGQPIWPKTVTGSITHDRGLAAAVVAAVSRVSAIGIDMVDLDQVIDDSTSRLIVSEKEIDMLGETLRVLSNNGPEGVGIVPVLLAFGAKEAAIKMVSPAIADYPGFLDIQLRAKGGALLACHSESGPETPVHWRVIGKRLFTLCCSTL